MKTYDITRHYAVLTFGLVLGLAVGYLMGFTAH